MSKARSALNRTLPPPPEIDPPNFVDRQIRVMTSHETRKEHKEIEKRLSEIMSRSASKEHMWPRELDVNEIIAQLWSVQSTLPLFKHIQGMSGFEKYPVLTWNVLGIIYRIGIQGHPGVLYELNSLQKSAITSLTIKPSRHKDIFAKAVTYLSQTLLRKLAFHNRFPNFTGGMEHQIDWHTIDPTLLTSLVTSLLDLQQSDIMCINAVLNLSTSIHYDPANKLDAQSFRQAHAKLGCLLWPIVPMITETTHTYEIIHNILLTLQIHSEKKGGLPLVKLFQDQHKKLAIIYDRVHCTDFLKRRCDILVIDQTPPQFSQNQQESIVRRTPGTSLLEADSQDLQELGPAPHASSTSRFRAQFLSPILGRKGEPDSRARAKSANALQIPDTFASSSSSSRHASTDSDKAAMLRKIEELRAERDEQKAIIASLETYFEEATAGMIHVDPEVVAQLQSQGLLSQANDGHPKSLHEKMTMHIQKQKDNIAALQQQLEEAQQELASQVTQNAQRLDAQTQEIHELQEALDDAKATISSMKDVETDLRQQLIEVQDDNSRTLESNHELLQQLETIKTEQQVLEKKFQEQVETSENVKSSLMSSQSNAESKVSALEDEKHQMTVLHHELEEEIKTQQELVKELKEENSHLRANYAKLEANVENLNSSLTQVGQEYVEAMERELENRKTITSLHQELIQTKKSHEENMERLTRQSDLLKESEVKFAEMATEYDALRQTKDMEIKTLQDQLATSGEKLLTAMQNDKTVSQELSTLQEQVVELRKQNQELDSTIQTKTQELSAMKKDLDAQMKIKDESLHEVQVQLKGVESEKKNLEIASEQLAKQMETTKSQLESKVKTLSSQLESTKVEHSKRVNELNSSLETVKSEKIELDSKLKLSEERVVKVSEEAAKNTVKYNETVESLRKEHEQTVQSKIEMKNDELEKLKQKHTQDLAQVVLELIKNTQATFAASQLQSMEQNFEEFQKKSQAISSTSEDHEITSSIIQAISALWCVHTTATSSGEDTSILTNHNIQALQQCRVAVQALLTGNEKKEHDAVSSLNEYLQPLKNEALTVAQQATERTIQLEEQLDDAEKTVDAATARIAKLLEQAKEAMSETTLDVNANILEHSMKLIRLIKELIKTSSVLQAEILERETGNKKDNLSLFYKKNSRWVDGFGSASKAVGAAATSLVDKADSLLQGEGKFEELMVCGQEISASTAQLVSASRVKADSDSQSKKDLEKLSKQVTEASRHLIDVARDAGHQQNKTNSAQDYLKLTYTQAKRLEMDTQIRVLELETMLLREQERLREIRKSNFHRSEVSEA